MFHNLKYRDFNPFVLCFRIYKLMYKSVHFVEANDELLFNLLVSLDRLIVMFYIIRIVNRLHPKYNLCDEWMRK